jgi:phenylalanyl-tRNA synthetase beta chain
LVTLLNPMVAEESALRGGLLPGLLDALRHNVGHRHPSLRLFEIGEVFAMASESGPASQDGSELPEEWEVVGLILADDGDDAKAAVSAWRVIADAFRLEGTELRPAVRGGLHPARTAEVVAGEIRLGVVGEIDPETLKAYDLPHSRAGWLELDLRKLAVVPRRPLAARPVSRFPSSDVDLAFVVADSLPAAGIEAALYRAAGELCESVELFDVYRGAGVSEGSRSLAYRIRFCALDRTLTDAEVAELRSRCIGAVESEFQATLRS